MKKNKVDIEATLFMSLLHLKEEKNKEYSSIECERNIVYLFNSEEDLKKYFKLNGVSNVDKEMLDLCIMKVTKKGTIIVLKGLCDYAISKLKEPKFNVLAVPCNVAFPVAHDKVDDFLNVKPDPEIRKQQKEMAEKFKINCLVDEEPIKIKKK